MCGRFTLRTPTNLLVKQFELGAVPDLEPRFNIAPTQDVAVVRLNRTSEKRELAMLHWGLIPFWAKEPKVGYSTINARAETVATKPSFREAFKKRRCLIVADGFYEWQKRGDRKQPYLIHMMDDSPFAFAGLWDRWKQGEEEIQSCSIIVTEPNAVTESIHDRMPLILSPDDYALWLDRDVEDAEKLQSLLRPYPPDEMEADPISTVVNNPRNERRECIARATA